MIKIIGDEKLCKRFLPGCFESRKQCAQREDKTCVSLKHVRAIAQAQMEADAKALLKAQTSLTILDPVGGPKEAWIAIKMPWEDYEDLKKAAEGGE